MKTWLPLAILAAGGTAAYLILRRKKPPTKQEEEPIKPPVQEPAKDFPIKFGSRGPLVVELQKALGVAADGIFGSNTLNALKQKANVSEIKDAAELGRVKNILAGVQNVQEADKARNKVATLFMQQAVVNKLRPLVISYETQGGEFRKDGIKYVYLNKTRILKKGERFADWQVMEKDTRGFVMVRLGKQYYKISPYALKF